jgi:hypothetical protein
MVASDSKVVLSTFGSHVPPCISAFQRARNRSAAFGSAVPVERFWCRFRAGR